MNRILIFNHYNPHGELASHVLYTLKMMSPFYERVVLVSNSPLKPENKKILQTLCHKIIERSYLVSDWENWKDALLEEGWNRLTKYHSLTLMNDTCFGPFFDMAPIYQQMDKPSIDYWEITDNSIIHRRPQCTRWHFITFNEKIIHSNLFQDFWKSVKNSKGRKKNIRPYETILTAALTKAGFTYQAYPKALKLSDYQIEMAHENLGLLINKGCPFIKIKLFTLFRHPSYLKKLIIRLSDYPVHLIDEHFSNTFPPNTSIKISNKNFFVSHQQLAETNKGTRLLVALHIHVFYLDIFKKYLDYLINTNENFDLYITTNTEEKKNKVISLLSESRLNHFLKGIFVFENKGRDVLPWLKISEILNHYDVVGHFHTKKTDKLINWVGDSWQNEIMDTLIQPMNKIIKLFGDNPQLGIVISDIPYYFASLPPGVDAWGKNKINVKTLWDNMNCKKELNIKDLIIPIMPYGTMFWYRPPALKPLFNLKFSDNDFLPEPLPKDGTIAHAIERLPVYLAWNEGYDFRIVVLLNESRNHYVIMEQIIKIRQSYNYKVGKLVLRLPKKIYRLLEKATSVIN